MTRCLNCGAHFQPARRGQRFCTQPGKNCRQNWHRRQAGLIGQVSGVRQLKGGDWSVTIRYPTRPAVNVGSPARVETASNLRQDAKSGENG